MVKTGTWPPRIRRALAASVLTALTTVAIAAATTPAAAQRGERWRNEWAIDEEAPTRGWGPRLGLTVNPDQFHFGVHYDVTGPAERLRLMPSAELGLGDDATLVAINLDAAARLRAADRRLRPFLGAGVALSFISWETEGRVIEDDSETEVGLHLFGGAEQRIGRSKTLFLELKVGVADAPDFKATAGMTFY